MQKEGVRELAVYIHLPFCVQKCLYCDFVSGSYDRQVQESYVNKLLWEIDSFFEELSEKEAIKPQNKSRNDPCHESGREEYVFRL